MCYLRSILAGVGTEEHLKRKSISMTRRSSKFQVAHVEFVACFEGSLRWHADTEGLGMARN